MVDEKVDRAVRRLQAKLITERNTSVSYSSVIGEILSVKFKL